MPLPVDDVIAIQQLYATYNHLIDAGRGEEWADLFVEDGTLDTGMGLAVDGNRDARIDFAANVPAIMPGSRHIISNLRLDGDASTATGAAYLQLWVADDEVGTKVLVTGVYRDTLRKVDGAWRFATRVLVPDGGGGLG